MTQTQAELQIPAGVPDRIRHYIDGGVVASGGGETVGVLEPGTYKGYVEGRGGRVLHRIAEAVEAQDTVLAGLESSDPGLPITQAAGQGRRAAATFRFFADLIVAGAADAYSGPGMQMNYVPRSPVGLAGVI